VQRFVERFSEELQEDFIKLVHNAAMKGDLKNFPINLLWVVTLAQMEKLVKMIHIFNIGVEVWS